MVNSVVVAGNVSRDPEVRRTQSGKAIVSFSLAVNERRKNSRTGEWEDYVNYFDVTAFGDRWEKLSSYISKGTKLTVQGHLKQARWEKDGQKRSKVEIIAEDVELPPKQTQNNYVAQASFQEVYSDDIPF